MTFRPEMTVIRFNTDDIIVASGGTRSNPVVLSKMHDSTGKNNTFSFGGKDYSFYKDNDAFLVFRTDLSNYVGDSGLASQKGSDIYFGGINVSNLSKEKNNPEVNGTYIYDGTGTYRFTRIQ